MGALICLSQQSMNRLSFLFFFPFFLLSRLFDADTGALGSAAPLSAGRFSHCLLSPVDPLCQRAVEAEPVDVSAAAADRGPSRRGRLAANL